MNPVSTTDRIQKLFDRINYERQTKVAPSDFKLSNMLKLMELLGNVHLDCPVIHVAGTKGKGSVSSLIGAILTQAGLNTGVYSSPHLETIHQRIVVNGREISDEDLQATLLTMEPLISEMDHSAIESGSKRLTFFEVITGAAFQHFSATKMDAVVLEVGMGGRLDSTNICAPHLCVITNISLDHTKQLGSTVEEIAGEKAGIIKQNVPVISGVKEQGPRDIIANVALRNQSNLLQLGIDFNISDAKGLGHFDFEMLFEDNRYALPDLRCGMPGEHQKQNAALAVASCLVLRRKYGWPITDDHIRLGIGQAKLPGRCEKVLSQPQVILDMAHNGASTIALAETLTQCHMSFIDADRKFLIFAASKEKNVDDMLSHLLPIFDVIVVTKFVDNPRSRAAEEVFDIAQRLIGGNSKEQILELFDSPLQAWNFVKENANNSDAVCITGSVFLVAELRPLFVKKGN